MFEHYEMTPLEEFVEELYQRHDIVHVYQLNVDEIAKNMNIWVHYAPIVSKGVEQSPGMYTMFIDNRITPQDQWLDFLHEICHLLRHAGNQIIMPELFTQRQEEEAEWFTVYAAMPFSMIKYLDVPSTYQEAVAYLAKEFKVSTTFARRRLDQIERRCFEGKMYYERNKNYILDTPQDISDYTDETKRILYQLQQQLNKRRIITQ